MYIMNVLYIILSFCIFNISSGTICKNHTENCSEDFCSEIFQCIHGICQVNGKCECFSCYTGPTCDTYIDDYKPHMKIASAEVFINPTDNPDIIYQVSAYDEDINKCQTFNISCPCSEFLFDMNSSFPYFGIDRSGELRINNGFARIPEDSYLLTVSLLGMGNGEEFNIVYDTMSINVKCREDKEESVDGINLIENLTSNFIRVKRNTYVSVASVSDVELVLTSPDPVTFRPGVAATFQINIVVASVTTNLKLKIMTKDTTTEEANLSIWGIQVISIGKKISSNIASTPTEFMPVLTMDSRDALYTTVADINFGTITNADIYDVNPPFDDSTISSKFGVIMNRNTYFTNANTKILVGVEYGNGQYIWIAEASFPYEHPTDSVVHEQKFYLRGPDNLQIMRGGHYLVSSYIPKPFATVNIEISAGNLYHDKLSIEYLEVRRKGSLTNILNFSKTLVKYRKSVTSKTNFMAKCTFTSIQPHLTNKSESIIIDDLRYEYQIYFVVYINEGIPGETHVVYLAAQVENGQTTSHKLNIQVDETIPLSVAVPLPEVISFSGSQPSIRTYESEVYGLKFSLDVNKNNEIICAATTSDNNDVVAGVMYDSSGIYVARFPDLQGLVIYNEDGSASWNIIINATVINSDLQYDTSETYIMILISIYSTVTSPAIVNLNCNGQSAIIPATTHNTDSPSNILSGEVMIPQAENKWYVGSVASLSTIANFKGTSYSDAVFSAQVDLEGQNFGVSVCKLEILKIGIGAASILRPLSDMNKRLTFSRSGSLDYNDLVNYTIGPIGGGIIQGAEHSDYNVEFRIYYDLPLGQVAPNAVVPGDYSVITGLYAGGKQLFVGDGIYSVLDSSPPYVSPWKPQLIRHLSTISKNSLGQAQLIYANLKTYPGIAQTHKITALPGTNAQICGITIMDVGRNLGCINKNFYDYPNDPQQKIKITYDDVGGITLNLGIQRNFDGDDNYLFPYDYSDEDSIGLGIFIRHKDITVTSGALLLELRTGETEQEYLFKPPQMDFNGGGELIPSDQELTMTAPAEVKVFKKLMAFFDVVINVPENYQRNVKIISKVPITEPSVKLCSMFVLKAGQNVPCVARATTGGGVIEETSEGSSLTLDMGLITHYVMRINNESENEIRIKVGLRLIEEIATDSSRIILSLEEQGTESVTSTVSVTKNGDYVPVPSDNTDGYTTIPMPTTGVKAADRIWVYVNATIPKFTTKPLTVSAFTNATNGRAEATVNAIRIKSVGRNMGCILPEDLGEGNLTSIYCVGEIPLVHNSQKNAIITNPFYVTNTGITYTRQDFLPDDDIFQIEAEFFISDHDYIQSGSSLNVYFNLKYSDDIMIIQPVELTLVDKIGNKPSIDSSILLLGDHVDVYGAKSLINLGITLRHNMTESTAEIYDAVARVCLPKSIPYVDGTEDEYTQNIPNNTFYSNVPAILRKGPCLDFDISYLLFTDNLTLNLSVTVDPFNKLPFGIGILKGTAVLRFLGRIGNHSSDVQYITKPSILQYSFGSADYFENLRIDTFIACQFSASTAISTEVGPEKAASPTGLGWRPAVYPTNTYNQFIVIDFLRKVRITRIETERIERTNSLATYKLKKSADGLNFVYVCDTVLPADNSDLPLICRFIARFAMIEVISTSQQYETSSLALRFKLYGKDLGDTPLACPSPMVPTRYANQKGWSHYVLDTAHNIIYICYYRYIHNDTNCWSSADGSKFQALYPGIKNLEGYDSNSGMTYAKVGYHNTFLASEDGLNWNLVSDSMIPPTLSSPPDFISASPKQTFTETLVGNWKITYEGILNNGILKIRSEG